MIWRALKSWIDWTWACLEHESSFLSNFTKVTFYFMGQIAFLTYYLLYHLEIPIPLP